MEYVSREVIDIDGFYPLVRSLPSVLSPMVVAPDWNKLHASLTNNPRAPTMLVTGVNTTLIHYSPLTHDYLLSLTTHLSCCV